MSVEPEAITIQMKNGDMLKLLLTTIVPASTSVANAQRASYTVEHGHTFVYLEVVHSVTSTTRGRFDDVGELTLLGKAQPVTLRATRFNCYDNPGSKRQPGTTRSRTGFARLTCR